MKNHHNVREDISFPKLYVLLDRDGNLAVKSSGNGGLPVFQSEHKVAVNRDYWAPKYDMTGSSDDLIVVEYTGGRIR